MYEFYRDIFVKKLTQAVSVAGQLTIDDLANVRDAGFVAVVNHRPDDEEPGQPGSEDLEAEAGRLGLEYVWAPVTGFPGAEAVEATTQALAAADGQGPVLMFCRSGMRSTAAWALAERARGGDAHAIRSAAAAAGYDLSRLPL